MNATEGERLEGKERRGAREEIRSAVRERRKREKNMQRGSGVCKDGERSLWRSEGVRGSVKGVGGESLGKGTKERKGKGRDGKQGKQGEGKRREGKQST